MCTPTWTSLVITTDESRMKPGEMYKMPKYTVSGGNHLVFVVVVCKRGSQLSWRFRSFYLSNNWDVKHWTNKDAPVKTPENRSSTSCSIFPLLPAVLLCSFSLSAAPPSLDQCVQKVNRNGAYNSVVLIAGFGILAHRPASVDRCVWCGKQIQI